MTSMLAGLASVLGGLQARVSRLRLRRKSRARIPAVSADQIERLLLLQGRVAARTIPVGKAIRNLSDVEFRVSSQWGEDGIIEWLVAHVDVPNQRFVEFGVDNFREANCRFLLKNRGWKGLVLDGSAHNIAAIKSEPDHWRYDLAAKSAFITVDNINALIDEAGFGGPLGILSIDIDGNDYWIWKIITSVQPAIVICEYNAVLGDTRPIVVPYNSSFRRHQAHFSGQYFGASIAALTHLARDKGYTFVGTNTNGVNAFFVKDEVAAPVLALLGETKAFASRHRDSRDEQGKLTFITGAERYDLIRELPVMDIATGDTLLLRDMERPYSRDWLDGMS
jgi:hypothetical protein